MAEITALVVITDRFVLNFKRCTPHHWEVYRLPSLEL